jgi:hypothetical protein
VLFVFERGDCEIDFTHRRRDAGMVATCGLALRDGERLAERDDNDGLPLGYHGVADAELEFFCGITDVLGHLETPGTADQGE